MHKKYNHKYVILTMGDAAGIGPEICVKAALSKELRNQHVPIVIGDEAILKATIRAIDKKAQCNIIETPKDIVIKNKIINIFSPKKFKLQQVKAGRCTKETGKASFNYVEEACHLIKKGWSDKLVTAPISKEAWYKAGVSYPGHTEAIADISGSEKYAMIFVNEKLKVVLATRHIALKDVAKKLDKHTIKEAVDVGIDFLNACKIKKKRIGVCNLNPHAGDKGVIGKEEMEFIAPLIRSYKKKNVFLAGPMSSDAVFQNALLGEFDLVVALYHDQGILPLKVISPHTCVNITFGLGFVRTSPGHGTAFDIAGKFKANPAAMIEAVKWAMKINS